MVVDFEKVCIWGICIVLFSLINLAAAELNKLTFPIFFVWDVNLSPIHFLVNLAIAMHGLINDSIGLGGTIESESFVPQLFTEVNLLIPTAIAAIFVILRTRGKLGIKAAISRSTMG